MKTKSNLGGHGSSRRSILQAVRECLGLDWIALEAGNRSPALRKVDRYAADQKAWFDDFAKAGCGTNQATLNLNHCRAAHACKEDADPEVSSGPGTGT